MRNGLDIAMPLPPCGEADVPADRQFGEMLQALQAPLRGYLRQRLPQGEGLDDAAQETCLRMLRYRHVCDIEQVRALLFRVAASVVADRYRHGNRHPGEAAHFPLDEVELPSPEPELDRVVAGRDDLLRIREAIAGLPPRCRDVFVLSRFEGLSYQEIARRFGTSVRTVENQVAHALAVCRGVLGEGRQ